MEYFELDQEEKDILVNYEKGEFKSITNNDKRKKYQNYVIDSMKNSEI
jgi:hypothetical protein